MPDPINELSQLRADVPEPSQDSLRHMRVRMLDGTRPRFWRSRSWLKVGIAGVTALALSTGIILFQGVTSPSPDGTGGVQFGQPASAQEILDQAARTVREQQPEERPRDDQFIYQKTRWHDTSGGDRSDEKWRPFTQPKSKSDPDDRTPKMLWEYNQTLPSDPDQIRKEIYAEVDRIYRNEDMPIDRHERALWLSATILGAGDGLPAPPPQRAALFRMMASIPGVKVEVDFEDLVGRTGIYVHRGKPGDRDGYIFASDTYDYLGRHSEDPGWTREEVRKLENTPPEIAESLMEPTTIDEVLLERKVVDHKGDK